jgi:hypothetical protein
MTELDDVETKSADAVNSTEDSLHIRRSVFFTDLEYDGHGPISIATLVLLS